MKKQYHSCRKNFVTEKNRQEYCCVYENHSMLRIKLQLRK